MAETGGDGPIKLQRHMSLFNGVGIIVGIIVGSGIFVSPKGVIMESGSVGACLLVWGLCGVICTAGALCYAELGTCIVSSGADFIYIRESLGDLTAFLYLWVTLVVIEPAGNAITALTFATYILQPFFPNCSAPNSAVLLVAAVCIYLLTFINCYKVGWAIRVQDLFTCAKVIALVLIIVIGFVKIAMGHTENLERPFEGTTTDPGTMSLAFYSGLFSYSGWNCLNFVTEELKDPNKNLPRAIFISLPLVTTIYILVNVAYFGVFSPVEMIASDAVAVTFADRTLGVMSWIMPVFVAFSTFGSLNGGIFTTSRLYFVGARHGHLPGFLASINVKHMTPIASFLFAAFPRLLWLCAGDVFVLIKYSVFIEAVFKLLVIVGLIALRVKRPDLKRPIKVSLVIPAFYLIVCAFLILTTLLATPTECIMGLVIAVTGIPVYYIGVRWKEKPKEFRVLWESCSNTIQKLFLAVHEELQDD